MHPISPRPGAGGNGNFEGAHLNDVVARSWGFTANDLGFIVDGDTSLGLRGNNRVAATR